MAIWGDSTNSDLVDFSPSATIVPFDPPIPLLRGPIPAAPSDSPDAGPFVLAFRSASGWISAFESTQSKLIDQFLLAELAGWSVARHDGCLYGRLTHVLDVLSMHQTNANPHGERACLETRPWIMLRGRGVKRGRLPPALQHLKNHASRLQNTNASHPFETQGSPPPSGRELHMFFLPFGMLLMPQKMQLMCWRTKLCSKSWIVALKLQTTEEVLY